MGETEVSKRLVSSLKTADKSFSEITAISQQAINKAMGNLMIQHPELADLDSELPGVGSLKAKIGKPQVSLKVTGASRANAEYLCTFPSGTLQLLQGDDYGPMDVSGWIIAFTISLDKVDVEEGSDEDQKVRSAIQQPGDFSISSLFLTFSASSVAGFDMEHSDFRGTQLNDMQKLYLGMILANWYTGDHSVMYDRQKRTVAYGIHSAKPETVNENAPTFPPTALKFQTYEYIAPGRENPEEGIPNGDSNMLLYLQMTEHKDFPKEAILDYSGNFVSKGMNGTTCIGREIFWDSYLLRTTTPLLLNVFNPSTYAWVKKADTSDMLNPTWEIGLGEIDHFTNSSQYCWKQDAENAFQWTWNPQNEEQSYYKEAGGNEQGDWLRITCKTNNTMKTQLGSNKICINGKTELTIECQMWLSIIPHAYSMGYRMHIWVTWSSALTLNSVPDGGLKISVDTPKFDVQSDPLQSHADVAFGGQLKDCKAKFHALNEKLKAKLSNFPLVDAEKALESDLTNAARFVVPGGGTFRYENPIFNSNGDLMIEASYEDIV